MENIRNFLIYITGIECTPIQDFQQQYKIFEYMYVSM